MIGELDKASLREIADKIVQLMRERSSVPNATSVTVRSSEVTTGSGSLVQVFVSDDDGNALLSVSVEFRAPRKSHAQLTLTNRVHH